MGNIMGNGVSNGINLYLHPEITPDPLQEPKNNPLEGFDKLRKERTVKATKAEMESAKIALQNRDYCVDELLRFKACRKDVWPFAVRCEHEKHAYLNCQYEDYVIRMKEYERERRLMERSAAINAAA